MHFPTEKKNLQKPCGEWWGWPILPAMDYRLLIWLVMVDSSHIIIHYSHGEFDQKMIIKNA